MSNTFFINWQDPISRRWYPVAKLMRASGYYIFAYTRGSEHSQNFLPFGNMTDLRSVYVSKELFPIFANRVMNERRPEFRRYSEWSGMDSSTNTDPLLLMARMGGGRATDTLQVYPVPEKSKDGMYRTVFFCHGIRHLSDDSQKRTLGLTSGERLFLMLDLQNPFDPGAVALRSSDPATMVGYCPRYLSRDMALLAEDVSNALQVTVKRVNLDAPVQFRLLCEAVSWWPKDFEPCADYAHETICKVKFSDIIQEVQKLPDNEQGLRRSGLR